MPIDLERAVLSTEDAFAITHKPCGCYQVFQAIVLSTCFSTLGQISYALAYLEDTKELKIYCPDGNSCSAE